MGGERENVRNPCQFTAHLSDHGIGESSGSALRRRHLHMPPGLRLLATADAHGERAVGTRHSTLTGHVGTGVMQSQ